MAASSSLKILNGVQHMPENELGRGSYGSVYKVCYMAKVYAAKRLHPDLIQRTGVPRKENYVFTNFLRECEHCSTLRHPNIVEFFGLCYPEPDIPVIVMELLDESLTDYIDRKSIMEVAFLTKISILFDTASGLDYLHSQNPPVMHRDLSPNNILLKGSTAASAVMIAKIGDLGLAKAIKIGTQSKLSTAPGTLAFMPPEAVVANPQYGVQVDVFSFGGIILYLATHQLPIPTALMRNDPVVNSNAVIFTEVERRQQYLENMAGKMECLKSLAKSCLSNYPSKRPIMKDISSQLEPIKMVCVLLYSILKPW